jgi:hypothetical protein
MSGQEISMIRINHCETALLNEQVDEKQRERERERERVDRLTESLV